MQTQELQIIIRVATSFRNYLILKERVRVSKAVPVCVLLDVTTIYPFFNHSPKHLAGDKWFREHRPGGGLWGTRRFVPWMHDQQSRARLSCWDSWISAPTRRRKYKLRPVGLVHHAEKPGANAGTNSTSLLLSAPSLRQRWEQKPRGAVYQEP